MQNFLNSPVTQEEEMEEKSSLLYNVAAGSMQGWRSSVRAKLNFYVYIPMCIRIHANVPCIFYTSVHHVYLYMLSTYY